MFRDLTAQLRAIDCHSRMLEEDLGIGLGGQAEHLLEAMRDSSQKMGRMADDLLAFPVCPRRTAICLS